MALRRFIVGRGRLRNFFGKSSRNFVATDKQVGDFLKFNADLISGFAKYYIKFIFIVADTPHFSD